MNRFAALLFSLCLLSASARAQEDGADYAKGQKYLEKAAKAWSASLPREQLCGLYIGRQWVGSFTISIKSTSEKGAAFEMSIKGGLNAFNRSFEIESHSLFTTTLAPVASESTEKSDGKVETRKVTVADGAWIFRNEKEGDTIEKKGKVGPGTTLEAAFLPIFVSPDDDSLLLDSVENKKTVCRLKKLSDLRERLVDGKKEKCPVLEITHPGEAGDLWFFRPGGAPLEFQPGDAPIRVRPIPGAEMGKSLNEPLELKPPERRLVGLFVGIAKNDASAVSACFDFERFSSESVPGFADLPEDKKKDVVEAMQNEMGKNLLSSEMRSMFPDPGLVEDAVANGMKTTEKDGIARIQMFGQQTWKLYEVKEGPHKGQWLIFGIEQK